MRAWVALGAACLAGCSGEGDTTPIPTYHGDVLVLGDCIDDPAGVDEIALTYLVNQTVPFKTTLNPKHFDNDVGGEIEETQADVAKFMSDANFASYPLLTFPGTQAVGMWYHEPKACTLALEPDETHIVTDQDGNYILDLQFFDSSLNCTDACAAPQDLLLVELWSFQDTDPPAKFCRRIRPGCPPPSDG